MGVTESTLKWLDVSAAVVHGVQALVVIGLTVEVLDKRPSAMFNGGHCATCNKNLRQRYALRETRHRFKTF